MRILPTAVVLAMTAGCGTPNEFQPPPPPTVTVAPPVIRPVTTFVEFTGRTDAAETIEIRARVEGFLRAIHFDPSKIVEENAPLFEIEPESFEAAHNSALAEQAARKAAWDLAEVTLQRATEAYEKEAVTDLELEEKQAERDAAEAAYNMAQANVDKAALDLSYTKINAPVTGRVARDYVNIGNLVGRGDATLLTTIVVDDPMYAYFAVDERFLLERLRERGDRNSTEEDPFKVLLQFTDGTDYELGGSVDFGENRVNPETGTLEVRAVFPNPDGMLFPGLFVRVRFPNDLGDSTVVPELALQRDLAGPFLLVVGDDDTVIRRDVELGPQTGKERVILGGLEPSDRVIINGLQRARPDIQVTVETAQPPKDV